MTPGVILGLNDISLLLIGYCRNMEHLCLELDISTVHNAPATFQHLINLAVAGLDSCVVHLYDVVVFSDTWNYHIKYICALFGRLVEGSVTVNLAKCEFAGATVTYLGQVVGQGRVCPVDTKFRLSCSIL